MKGFTLDRIHSLSFLEKNKTKSIKLNQINTSEPFTHEDFTPLYYTSYYSKLNYNQKLRYNQLAGLRINEQFMFFEERFTNEVLKKLLKSKKVRNSKSLSDVIVTMIQEEELHFKGFQKLNTLAGPEIYKKRTNIFTRLRWHEKIILFLSVRNVGFFSVLLWFMIAMEEYSLYISEKMVKNQTTKELGSLESNFIRIHDEHKKDESRHVHIDVHLIQKLWPEKDTWKHKLNMKIVRKFFNNIVVPKRGGRRVINRWIQEFPELSQYKRKILKEMSDLGEKTKYLDSLFGKKTIPITHKLWGEMTGTDFMEHIFNKE